MEFNQFTRKLAKWAFIFQEYNFDVKHWARIINKDVDRLNRNPSSIELDPIKTCWHGETNLEIVFGCHVSFLCVLANGCQKVLCQILVNCSSIFRNLKGWKYDWVILHGMSHYHFLDHLDFKNNLWFCTQHFIIIIIIFLVMHIMGFLMTHLNHNLDMFWCFQIFLI
jgi:hypothetical protein